MPYKNQLQAYTLIKKFIKEENMHFCNHPGCKAIIIQTTVDKVFTIKKKDGKKPTFVCEACAGRALREIGILERPASIRHIHKLLKAEINKANKISSIGARNIRIVTIFIATYKIYGDNYPRQI